MKQKTLRIELLDEIAQLVVHQLNKTLAVAPKYPYQAVFSLHRYQEQLLLRVIQEIYSAYRLAKDENPDPVKMLSFCLSKEVDVESLVQQSAVQILEDDARWIEDVKPTSNNN